MAKIAVINREQKRRDTVKKFAAKRASLVGDHYKCVVERRRALCGASKIASIAARFQPGSFA